MTGPSHEAGAEIAERIGFLQWTTVRKTFWAIFKTDPDDFACDPDALPVHIDPAEREVPSRWLVLGCIASRAEGGALFADGIATAVARRSTRPGRSTCGRAGRRRGQPGATGKPVRADRG